MPSNLDHAPKAAPGIFPDGRFGPLIDAALRQDKAMATWQAYRQQLGAEVPNEGETRLYPLIAHNLKAHGAPVDDPAMLTALRRAHALSTVCLHTAEQMNALFARHGILVVFTKGLALQIAEYRNPVLRTFSDIDCCIRVEDIPAVVQLAEDQGWHNTQNLIPDTAHVVEAHAEMTFQLPTGVTLDIHWVPRRAFTYQPALIQQYFDTSEQVEWRGQLWRIPSATWRFIETVEHGVEANEVLPIRWIPDAVRLLENPTNQIDWTSVEAAASTARLRLVFLAGLTRLANVTECITQADLARFQGPRAPIQALELRARLNKRATMGHRLYREGLHYFLRAPGSILRRLFRFPAYVVKGAGRSARATDFALRLWRHKDRA